MRRNTIHSTGRRPAAACLLMVLAASSVCYAAGGPEDANEVTDPNSVAYWWQWTAPASSAGRWTEQTVRTLATDNLDGLWGIGLITATPDLDADADVDPLDLDAFLQSWLNDEVSWTAAWCAGRDLNADGVINLRDFATLAQSWAER